MNFLNSWLQGIVVAVIVATIIERMMPNGNNKKYIKAILGVYIVFNIIAPIVNKITSSKMEINSIINIDQYSKQIESYNSNSSNTNINESNDDAIKRIYKSNLENDMKEKLKTKGYYASKIEMQLDNSENYNIENVNVYLEQEEKKKITNDFKINEIEKIKININEQRINDLNTEENLTNVKQEDIKKIKEYLSDVYDISKEKINVY